MAASEPTPACYSPRATGLSWKTTWVEWNWWWKWLAWRICLKWRRFVHLVNFTLSFRHHLSAIAGQSQDGWRRSWPQHVAGVTLCSLNQLMISSAHSTDLQSSYTWADIARGHYYTFNYKPRHNLVMMWHKWSWNKLIRSCELGILFDALKFNYSSFQNYM